MGCTEVAVGNTGTADAVGVAAIGVADGCTDVDVGRAGTEEAVGVTDGWTGIAVGDAGIDEAVGVGDAATTGAVDVGDPALYEYIRLLFWTITASSEPFLPSFPTTTSLSVCPPEVS